MFLFFLFALFLRLLFGSCISLCELRTIWFFCILEARRVDYNMKGIGLIRPTQTEKVEDIKGKARYFQVKILRFDIAWLALDGALELGVQLQLQILQGGEK